MNPNILSWIALSVMGLLVAGIATASYKLGWAERDKKYLEAHTGLTVERVKNDFQIVEDQRKLNEANKNETGSDLDVIRATIKRVREHPASQ